MAPPVFKFHDCDPGRSHAKSHKNYARLKPERNILRSTGALTSIEKRFAARIMSAMRMLTQDEAPEHVPQGMLSVIIPVLNEASSIEWVIRTVQEVPLLKEIIVVDDGSTDGTCELLSKLASAPNLKKLSHERTRGKGAAIRTALASASGEFVVIQDADLEYDPGDLPALIVPLAAGEADAVYGVRQHDTAARGLALFMGARMLTLLTNLLYGCRIHDEATCYKAFRRSLLNRIVLDRDGFDFCPEVTAKICRLGKKIREVPISYHPRSATQGKKLRPSDGFAAVLTLLRYRFAPRRQFDRVFSADPYATAKAIGERNR